MAATAIPVLNYHAIDPHIGAPATRNVSVSLSDFKQQMQWLHQNGYRSVTTGELRNFLTGREKLSGKLVLITFDDGYHSLYEHALPVMSQYDLTATLFLSTSFIGKPYAQDDFYFVSHDRQLTWEEIKVLSEAGWSVQSHGNTHVKMTSLNRQLLEGELIQSKQIIEQHLGKQVYEFAYPYGIYNNGVIRALNAAGYEFGYSVHSGRLRAGSRHFSLPRIEINNMDTMDTFRVKVLTGYTSPGNAFRSRLRDVVFANPVVKDLFEKVAHRVGYGNR